MYWTDPPVNSQAFTNTSPRVRWTRRPACVLSPTMTFTWSPFWTGQRPAFGWIDADSFKQMAFFGYLCYYFLSVINKTFGVKIMREGHPSSEILSNQTVERELGEIQLSNFGTIFTDFQHFAESQGIWQEQCQDVQIWKILNFRNQFKFRKVRKYP